MKQFGLGKVGRLFDNVLVANAPEWSGRARLIAELANNFVWQRNRSMRNAGIWNRIKTSATRVTKRAKNQAGVTLMEVMVAIVILTIALLGLLGMGMVALDGNQWANNSTKTTHLMLEKIEELRASGALTSGSAVVDNVKLTWKVTSADTYLREVTVYATWTNERNQTSSNTLTTMVRTNTK
jgi:prepilin-type N-terminal cleavage/methylation domain-containing protein